MLNYTPSQDKTLYIECACYHPEHSVVMKYLRDDDYPNHKEIYIQTYLCKHNLWNRILYAIKYIFGYQSEQGAFQEVIISESKMKEIKDFIEYVEQAK